MNNLELIEYLEEKVFNCKFETLKKHFLFCHLNLSDEEIVSNSILINKVLQNQKLCNKKTKHCEYLDLHYAFKRHDDGYLESFIFECHKPKDLSKLNEQERLKIAQQKIKCDNYLINPNDLKKYVTEFNLAFNNIKNKDQNLNQTAMVLNHLKTFNEEIAKFIKKIANSYNVENMISFWNYNNKLMHSFLKVLTVLIFLKVNQKIFIISGNDFKQLIYNNLINKFNQYEQLYEEILNWPVLIIENYSFSTGIKNFYIENLTNILLKRKMKNLKTIILSKDNYQDLQKKFFNLNKQDSNYETMILYQNFMDEMDEYFENILMFKV